MNGRNEAPPTLSNIPVIPANVADAIESFRADGWDNIKLVGMALNNREGVTDRTRVIKSYAATYSNTLLAALVNGYTREKSPEEERKAAHERIRNEYRRSLREKSCSGTDIMRDYYNGKITGIRYTLRNLGVKIEGVNANTEEAHV